MGAVSVTRSHGKKATRPCRCGHLGDAALACSRAPRCAADYQSKVSGPLLDRIDLHVEVDPVNAADLALPPPAEGSAEVAARVAEARQRQAARGVRSNAELEGDALELHATPDEPGRKLLLQAAEALRLSARGYTRMLRVALTIADLAGADESGASTSPKRSATAGRRRGRRPLREWDRVPGSRTAQINILSPRSTFAGFAHSRQCRRLRTN